MFDALSDAVIPEPNSGCWIWIGASAGRYGQGPSREYAHRYAYRCAFGDIEEGACVLHRCDVPFCVNPAHLFLGTQADNMADMKKKGRHPGNVKTPGHMRPRSKLNPALVAYIRGSPKGPVAIAKELGVHRQTILRVRTGESH